MCGIEDRAKASVEGRMIGEAAGEAIHAHVDRRGRLGMGGSLRVLRAQEFPPGNEWLSEEIDTVVYGD